MSHSIVDFLPTPDPLLRAPRLDYSITLPVLGISTRFGTNSRYVLDVIGESLGTWRSVEVDGLRELVVTIVVHGGSERATGRSTVRHLCPDATRVIVHSAGSVGVSDPDRRSSVAYVTSALAADRDHFRTEVLEALTLALISHFDRHPVHAAALMRDDRAVLLAGATGAGKSTLAYLAHTAGIDVLSDDRVWVQREPRLRVWGWPGRVRLLPSAAFVFPELARSTHSLPEPNEGKLAIALPARSCRFVADRAEVCVLGSGTAASLERLEAPELLEALGGLLAAGFDRFPERHEAVLQELTAPGGWRLTLSPDPHEALPLLEDLLSSRA
jgi:hypothetical protein